MTSQEEHAEIIKNAEQAYRDGEISAEDLLQIRIVTSKYILEVE